LDVLIEASRAQLLNKTFEIAQTAPLQDLNEGWTSRISGGAWLTGLNLVRLRLLPLRPRRRRLSGGFLLLHGFVQRASDGIEDTTHP
jgi:hypothetical protein